MALIAEEVVEEWLNQQGFFTIRGIKLGVAEMDILAIRTSGNVIERRHYEVQASINPISYITPVPMEVRKREGRPANSAKVRTLEELDAGADEWLQKKFFDPKKAQLREKLSPGVWSFHLVINQIRHPQELEVLANKPIEIIRLPEVLEELKRGGEFTASGKDLIDLMLMERG